MSLTRIGVSSTASALVNEVIVPQMLTSIV